MQKKKKNQYFQKHEIIRKSENAVPKYMYLNGFGKFLKIFEDFCPKQFILTLKFILGIKTMFLVVFFSLKIQILAKTFFSHG